MLPVARCQLPV